jgi:hypothetical protein
VSNTKQNKKNTRTTTDWKSLNKTKKKGWNSRIRLYTGVTLDNPAGPKCGAETA